MRPRKSDRQLPQCVYFKHGSYYLVKRGKWERLGTDIATALAEYGRRMEAKTAGGLDDLIERAYANHLRTRKLSDNTKAQYRLAADKLKHHFADFEPGQVKGRHVAKLQDRLAGTPNMVNRLVSVLRIVFDYAVREGLVDVNPCASISRLAEPKRTRLISDSEWRAIHDKAGPRLRVIMELQQLTGQRIGDVLSIRRNQLTAEGIYFEQQKTDARLLVRWTPELRAAVKAAEALSADKPAALTLLRGRYNGAPDYRSVALQFAEACAAAGVDDAKLNDGRARSATSAKRQGKNAQALLGHTSPAMTERYIRDREIPVVDAPSIRQGLDVGRKSK